MPITGIASICFFVTDWDRAKRFYTDTLGLKLCACDDKAGWASLSAPGSGPPLFLVRNLERTHTDNGTCVGFDVTDGKELLADIVEAGGSVLATIQESETVRIVTIRDPDGNALEFCETKTSTV